MTTLAKSATRHIALPFNFKQLGFVLQLPALGIVSVCLLIYGVRWGMASILAPFNDPLIGGFLLLAAFPAGIVIHEWLHGLGYWIGGAPQRSIHIGLIRLTAYCRCDAPISVSAFRSAVVLPGLLLGVLPLVTSLWFGIGWLMLFGALMTSTALGDALILWALRGVSSNAKIMYRREIARYEIVEAASPQAGEHTVTNAPLIVDVSGQVIS